MRRLAIVLVTGSVLSIGTTILLACSAPDTKARVDAFGPDRTQFQLVHPVLQLRCGTLECHGTPYRNMRLYGWGGQRLGGNDVYIDGGFVAAPDAAADAAATGATSSPSPTPDALPETKSGAVAYGTDAEINASYDSVVGLEPEIMRDVVNAKGKDSGRLTFVRKGRGDEAHKGLQRYCPGDSVDRCIQSWLAGAVDEGACFTAGPRGPLAGAAPCAPQ